MCAGIGATILACLASGYGPVPLIVNALPVHRTHRENRDVCATRELPGFGRPRSPPPARSRWSRFVMSPCTMRNRSCCTIVDQNQAPDLLLLSKFNLIDVQPGPLRQGSGKAEIEDHGVVGGRFLPGRFDPETHGSLLPADSFRRAQQFNAGHFSGMVGRGGPERGE